MKTMIAVVAACLAVPAVAQGDTARRTPTIAAPVQVGGSSIAKKETRYCTLNAITGSRLPRKQCHTRSEWLAQGYDPLTDMKK